LVRKIHHWALRTKNKQKTRQIFKSWPAMIAGMEAFLVSTGIVALAEMGDKTQLLSLVLAARFRKPWPIVWGILVATLVNHGLAGAVGSWVTTQLGPEALRWVLGGSFLAMAVWILIPDKLDDEDEQTNPRWGIFATTVVAFFLAEMGDKTQIATVMLAAQFQSWLGVVAGTTLGMMLANAPVVWLGDAITRKISLTWVHRISAVIFAILGLLALWGGPHGDGPQPPLVDKPPTAATT
jgi:putative Ca2+/H+ antiporter (TMEM165/GDT1 family)